ncbi:MAG: peptide chain release factor N(5)-glutamine methyltransferase [Betaproteobacteria bacterium]|nr:peptide chain release factor N(5)-glutamine methyltransferase [Betaproteobacteria bacterium]
MSTWRELLAASGLPRLEAQLLASHGAGVKRSWLLAHEADVVAPDAEAAARALFARRQAGEPVTYILGEREFFGLSFAVTPAVLIPRPETELLVELARSHLPEGGRLLDVGTGSGAVAVAIAHLRPDAEVWACDLSPAALAVARANAARNAARVTFVESDLLAALAGERFDVIASNPPYVAEGDPHLAQGDLRFEPALALASGPDGLDLIRRLAVEACRQLRPGGRLVFEHGHDQGPACCALLRALGYNLVNDYNDLASVPRVCLGRWPGSAEPSGHV